MPRSVIPLSQRGGSFMWTTRAEKAPAGSYHYALNVVPLEPQRADSLLVQRPALAPFVNNGSVTGTILATGWFAKATGVGITWILSTDGLWEVQTGAYTKQVTTANLTTAGITVSSGTHYWCVFNNTVVFNPSDGTQQPWTWDGSPGAGGLAELTNAPVAYGRPTVRSSKLFFVKYALRDTLAWSEELSANTGYEAGGYSNVWKLGQSGTSPIYAIQGTNEALYYFRQASIGVIRGEVNNDFVTSSTHDAISSSVGTTSPAGVCLVDADVWFVDQRGIPYALPAGGQPVPLIQEVRSEVASGEEPFGLGDIGWDRSSTAALTGIEVMAVPSLASMPYRTIWFHYAASLATAGRCMLVCHAETRRALAWFVPYCGFAVAPYLGMGSEATNPIGRMYPHILQASGGTLMRWGDSYSNGDANASGTAQATKYRVIGAPLGGNDIAEYQFDRLDTVASASGTTSTMDVQLLTSRRDSSASIGAALTPVVGTSGSLDRISVGFKQSGRWARPVYTITSATLGKWNLGSWTVWAYPIATGPTAP